MNIYDDMQKEIKELVRLIRLDEQFFALCAHGALNLDRESTLSHHQRVIRIEELSRKYGLL